MSSSEITRDSSCTFPDQFSVKKFIISRANLHHWARSSSESTRLKLLPKSRHVCARIAMHTHYTLTHFIILLLAHTSHAGLLHESAFNGTNFTNNSCDVFFRSLSAWHSMQITDSCEWKGICLPCKPRLGAVKANWK